MKSNYDILSPFLSEERRNRFESVLKHRTRHLSVVLENVYQSRNASAVMRSCDGFGIQDVHLIEDINPWVFNRGVSKGTPTWLTLHRYRGAQDPTTACLKRLREKGYRIVVTSPHVDGYEIQDLPVNQPVALVMGTEWKGASERMLNAADDHVRIPMRGFAESLNISVAAAVGLHNLTNRIRSELTPEIWGLDKHEKAELRDEWAAKSVRGADAILRRHGVEDLKN
ncbi:MAG: TrmH family RNA methyltransferase [Flavobacteriales bacterium]